MPHNKEIIGLIGLGNMGSAIFERLKNDFQFYCFDKDKNRLSAISDMKAAGSNAYLVKAVDSVILALKPQDFETVLKEIKDFVNGKLIISIAAGIATSYIERYFIQARVVRAMPNLPARIGEGVTALCKGTNAQDADLEFAGQLFKRLGSTIILQENMMDAVTAVSGSGPGFLYDMGEKKDLEELKAFANDIFLPALNQAAVNIGFSYDQARLLAEATTTGSIAFLEKSGASCAELKARVASKGGTTEAGLEALHKGAGIEEAVKAALKRSRQLSETLEV